MPMAMKKVTQASMITMVTKNARDVWQNHSAASFRPRMPSSGVKKIWRSMSL